MFLFIVGVLAVWRLSFLFSKEDGPWNLIYRWKKRMKPEGFWWSLSKCLNCLSIWFSIFIAPFVVEGHYWRVPLYAFALSGAALIIHYGLLED